MPFKKARRLLRKGRKAVKKLIPREIRPALPFIAAAAPIPGIGSLAARGMADQFVKAALVRAATDDEADLGDVLRTGTLAAAPQAISKGLGSAGRTLSNVKPDSKFAQFLTSKGTGLEATLANPSFMDTAKIVGGQTGIEQAAKFAEIRADEIEDYNKMLAEQGIRDRTKRRTAIRNIYLNAGYTEDYVDGVLDRFGYAGGGMTMEDIIDMAEDAIRRNRKRDDEEDEDDFSMFLEQGQKGLMSLRPQTKPMPIRPLQMAEGGIMNLGGNEMDLRGGGFVPIGKKEKADDVPARLSKNEFVMTADAVRGAGGGDINEGAKRMYQTMDKLEAMA